MNTLHASNAFELRFNPLFADRHAFSFPCDATGHVDMDSMSERVRNSYLYVRARDDGPGGFVAGRAAEHLALIKPLPPRAAVAILAPGRARSEEAFRSSSVARPTTAEGRWLNAAVGGARPAGVEMRPGRAGSVG